MLKVPKGRDALADLIGNAVKVMRIATGEEPEDYGPEDGKDPAAKTTHGKLPRLGRASTKRA